MSFLRILCAVALGLAACAHPPVHWSYERDEGPTAWASLAPEFAACASGQQQSPIDLREAQPGGLAPLSYRDTPFVAVLENNGHTLEAAASGSNVLTLGERTLELVQFHFHHPSEHALDGRRFPLEIHFVHRDAAGKLGVVGVFVEAGGENAALAGALSGKAVAPSDFFPSDRTYFLYDGSLTTPPCTEGVTWVVFAHPIAASEAQLAELTSRFHENSRPLMPLNGRSLKSSR